MKKVVELLTEVKRLVMVHDGEVFDKIDEGLENVLVALQDSIGEDEFWTIMQDMS